MIKLNSQSTLRVLILICMDLPSLHRFISLFTCTAPSDIYEPRTMLMFCNLLYFHVHFPTTNTTMLSCPACVPGCVVQVPGDGVLVLPSHPDTVAFRHEDHEHCFTTSGLTITPLTPMRSWRLHFSGKLRLYNDPKDTLKDVTIDLLWSSNLPYFDYDTDMDTLTIAQAFARDPWTRKYFQQLQEHHQTHYEQMGHLQGSVTLNGNTQDIHLPAFRDHSYGKLREWRLMHRYVFHHVFLENGCKGVVGVVCQPSTCSRLVLGNWWSDAGEGVAVTGVDLDLRQHGEGGTPPTDYAFTFRAGGEQHVVEVEVEASPQHYLGWDWEARMVETWVKYRVDGVRGSGICEWNYRHCGGRPEALNDQDPAWAAEYRPKYLAA
ncbi:hypothetical protein GWK47_012905 [Chionoecetes opilio]|uniref:Uncharacterized protein n=1 Tax=Chionoecetes opilio TaxID=41210 RepID=A0A8J4XVZ1_CHIOP|nr:hypothetical protein GWK47_012905 [Chionoecetes opilio]